MPCALPYFFSAIKMAVPMSIIGAAIGEWLGAQSGLGYFSRRMMTQLDGAGVFAPIVLLSAVAMLAVAAGGPAGAAVGPLAGRVLTARHEKFLPLYKERRD